MWNLKEKLTKLGDLNGDGKIDTEDLVYLKEKGKEKLHQIEEKATSVVNGAMKSKTLKGSVQDAAIGASIGRILPVGGPEIGAVVGATIGYVKSKKDAEDIAARRTATRRANAEAAEEKAAGTPARSVAEKSPSQPLPNRPEPHAQQPAQQKPPLSRRLNQSNHLCWAVCTACQIWRNHFLAMSSSLNPNDSGIVRPSVV